jgi:UDP-3-O-[3-hydroxymyristoyl] N-acetylglucosamine deacetylase/3-hydroxyacyl-[acyl-carrier-protein] dehydratase
MDHKQQTLRDVAVVRGAGAFTGDDITVEIHPAEADHGPSLELLQDGEAHPIPVSVENIIETENRTVLADLDHPDRQVNIVEHLLATLHGLGVDNAIIRVNSIEMPLIDGSALPYLQAIDAVGLVEQNAPRREIVIDRPVFIDENALLLALPFDGLRITYYLDHPKDIVGKRIAQIDVTPDNFRRRIAPARTFIKAEKADEHLATGAVKHTDRDQVLIVYQDRISQPLRFADEYCYHKMLDILGDLYLLGRRLRGHVVGVRSGHHQNRKMARTLAGIYL